MRLVPLFVILVLFAVRASVVAQEASSTAAELAELKARLEAAERRIKQLEAKNESATDGSSLPSADNSEAQGQKPAPSAAPKLDERLEEVESDLGSIQEKLAEAEKPSYPNLEIGGRIQLDYWAFPETTSAINFYENPRTGVDPEARFQFRRLRLELEGDISETMTYRAQVDFNEAENPQYKDVYIGFDELPGNQTFQIGNQKRPIGLDPWNSSRVTVFTERALVTDVYNEDYRRLGLHVLGYSDDESIAWQYGIFNLENTSSTGRYIGDSLQLSGNARLVASPWYDESSNGRGYLHLGLAGMVARPDGNASPLDSNENEAQFHTRPEARSTNRWLDTGQIPGAEWYEIVGLETMLNIGPTHIFGEYLHSWLQREIGPQLRFQGAYIAIAYTLTGEHVPYQRSNGSIGRLIPFENFFLVERCRGGLGYGWGAWQVALRYSWLDLTDDDIQGGTEHNTTFGLNWYWTPNSKVQFNAIYGDIHDRPAANGLTSGHFVALGTRFMVDY